jgi:hypothetical protein
MTTIAETFLKRDYPGHECPETLELHGDSRPGAHANGEGFLLYVCLIQTQCGCKVVGNGTLMHPILIEPCEQHRAGMYHETITDKVSAQIPVGNSVA